MPLRADDDVAGAAPVVEPRVDDPHVLYDQHERRWMVLAVAKVGPISPAESYLLLSVSQSEDPLGAWWSWVFDARLAGTTLPVPRAWADYPCLGVDATAAFVSLNADPQGPITAGRGRRPGRGGDNQGVTMPASSRRL